MLVRRLLVCALLVVAGLLIGASSDAARTGATPAAAPERALPERDAIRALQVLHHWDRRRASAYAAGSPAALRRLYAPASSAGMRDVRRLREYAARGLVVEGLAPQVLDVELVERSATMVRLRVTDRLTGATAVTGRREFVLPTDTPRTRVVTLVRHGPRWLVRSVRPG